MVVARLGLALPLSCAVVSATGAVDGSAILTGAANPRGSATTVWFRYDTASPGTCNDTFGTRAPDSGFVTIGAGRVEAPFTEPVTALDPGTYYACAIGSNAAGVAFGEVLTFEVPAPSAMPTVGVRVPKPSSHTPGSSSP